MRAWYLAVLVPWVCACGGAITPTADVPTDAAPADVQADAATDGAASAASLNGTFFGATLTPRDAVWEPSRNMVVIANFDAICTSGFPAGFPAHAQAIAIDVQSPQLGTIDLATTPFDVSYLGCAIGSEVATSGTVTFTRVDADGVEGHFDLVFGGTDHVTGMFSAPACEPTVAPDAAITQCQ